MIDYITSNKQYSELREIMEKINDYIRWGNRKSLSDDLIKVRLQDQYNNCRRALETVASFHEIDVQKQILSSGPLKIIKKWTKKTIRKMIVWYLQDIAEQQTQFNVKSVETFIEQQNLLELLMRENMELKENFIKLSNDIHSEDAVTDQWNAAFSYEYCSSKEQMQKRYLKYFKDKKRVVDLRCGRGEFIELLTKQGIHCVGIDKNKKVLEEALEKKLKVKNYDCIEYLSSLKKESMDGIFACQVLERLSVNQRIQLFELAYEKLSFGGIFVFESENPPALGVFNDSLYMDPFRFAPVHPNTLKFIALQTGFRLQEICYIDECSKDCKFEITSDMSEGVKAGFKKLNQLIYGAKKFYFVCIKGEDNA